MSLRVIHVSTCKELPVRVPYFRWRLRRTRTVAVALAVVATPLAAASAVAPHAALRTVTLDQIGADPAALGGACLAALDDA